MPRHFVLLSLLSLFLSSFYYNIILSLFRFIYFSFVLFSFSSRIHFFNSILLQEICICIILSFTLFVTPIGYQFVQNFLVFLWAVFRVFTAWFLIFMCVIAKVVAQLIPCEPFFANSTHVIFVRN